MKTKIVIKKSTCVISKDDLLGDIEKRCPKALEFLVDHGLHCATCFLKDFETVEMGAKVHGMTDKQIEKMINEINIKLDKI